MRTKRMVGLLLAGVLLCSCLASPGEQRDLEGGALSTTSPTETSAAAGPTSTSHDTTTTSPITTTTTGPAATTAATTLPSTTATTSPTTAPTTTNPPPTTTTAPPTTTTAPSQSPDEEGKKEEEAGQEPPAEEEQGAEEEQAAEEEQSGQEPPAEEEQGAEEGEAAQPEEETREEAADAEEETREAEQTAEQQEPRAREVHDVTVSTVEFMPGLLADIHAPTRPGDYPVVTLSFGRGWSISDRSQLTALSHYLATQGIVAINGEYRTLLRNGRLSSMAGEVACLAAAAPHMAQPHLSGPAGPVWLLGYSAGAHLAALAALDSHPLPRQCPHAPGDIAGMIGLGGPYDLDELWNSGVPDYFFDSEAITEGMPLLAGVLRRGDVIAMQFFLRLLTGVTPEDTEEWDALSPLKLADLSPQLSFMLVTGDQDELIYPLHAERFGRALIAGGHQVVLRIIPHTDHQALFDPDNVGEAIRAFVGNAP